MNPSAAVSRCATRSIISRFPLRAGGHDAHHGATAEPTGFWAKAKADAMKGPGDHYSGHREPRTPTGNAIQDAIDAADEKMYGHGYYRPGETFPGKSKVLFGIGYIVGFGFPVFAALWQKSK